MPICKRCAKWPLLAERCPVCTSADRLLASIANPRIPATYEAEAKVTKVLDSAFYSISRLVPEDDSPKKGDRSPSPKAVEKASKATEERGRGESARGGTTKGEASPRLHSGERRRKSQSPKKEAKEKEQTEESKKPEESEKKEEVTRTVQQSEEKKVLPKRREEERTKRERSRTPKHQKEKEKRKAKKRDSNSRSVSGSVVRRKKREDHTSHKPEKEEEEKRAKPSSGIQRESYLRPRPSRREARSPRTPDHPPPKGPPVAPGQGRGVPQGKGWQGRVPYSHHPRWTESTNKGVTKRAKQELYERRQYRDRW